MNKLLIGSTIGYLILIYASPLFQKIPGVVLLREGYVLLLLFLCSINIFRMRVNKLNSLIIVYTFVNLISFFLSPNKSDAVGCFICYVSGPLVFFGLTNIVISKELFFIMRKKLNYLFFCIIILSLLIYPLQEKIYALFGFTRGMKDFLFETMYRIENGGLVRMRLSGFCLHPTTMGYICILFLIYNVWLSKRIRSAWALFPYYLTDTRSVIFGIPFAFYQRLNKKYKILMLFTVIPLMVMGVIYFAVNLNSIRLDDSAFKHFTDLFFLGPMLVADNLTLFGFGHATMSPYFTHGSFLHVESELYIALIQIGIVGVAIYFLILRELYKGLMKDPSVEGNYCLYLLFIFNIGCLFLALYAVRFISNYMWIELGLYFSYRRNLKVCHK